MLNRKIAWIDLTNRTVNAETIPMEWRRKYLGARGINNFLQWSLTDSKTDPWGPEAPLIIGAGWMTGIPSFGGRVNVAGISARATREGCGNIGGYFGPEMRYAGFDHLVIRGKSKTPVYLMITDDNIEILDAGYLWGLEVRETQEAIRTHHDDHEIRSLVVGPAGENLVAGSPIMTGWKDAGGGGVGMGALMGSKKLKAIAARGTGDIKLAHPKEYLSWIKEQQDLLLSRKWVKALGRYGTPLLFTVSAYGWSASRKTGDRLGKAMAAVSAEKLDPYTVGMAACYGCAVHCRHRHYISEGKYAGTKGEGPEFSHTSGVGVGHELMDIEAVMAVVDLCNRLGTSGVGGEIHKLLEEGSITEKDIGYYVDYGDADAVMRLITDKAYRRTPFGNILADGEEGIKRLSEQKGVEISIRREGGGRGPVGFALGQVVGTNPGSSPHRNRPGIEALALPDKFLEDLYGGGPVSGDLTSYVGKSRMVWWHEMVYALGDSLGICRFQMVMNSPHMPKHEEYQEMIRLTTGLDFSIDELKDIANRIDTIERLILGQHGYGSRATDTLPPGSWVDAVKFEEFLDQYYELHDWDNNGVPTKEMIKRLGIAKVKRL